MSAAPIVARSGHSAIWTGKRMIAWGGLTDPNIPLGDGAFYDPASDTWPRMSNVGAPGPFGGQNGVWTGTTFIVWGIEVIPRAHARGGRYTPLSVFKIP